MQALVQVPVRALALEEVEPLAVEQAVGVVGAVVGVEEVVVGEEVAEG